MRQTFWCDHTGPFVDTTGGTVRGYKLNDLYIFKGIKYATAKRFERAVPEHWDGFRDAITYGPVAPTIMKPSVGPNPAHKLDPCFNYNFWPESEDCLFVNVWTKSINSKQRKPVMVWLHGGGWGTGSSVEQHSYDPSNLVDENDVVVVSLNHRLNILGFFDLSDYGEKYSRSRNSGIDDIVLALKWVRDNIERFGGDPCNVTLFGQSGGGFKIQAMMQMSEAFDLFHKVIIQSGVQYPPQDEKKKFRDGKILAAEVVNELGITPETIDRIQDVPFDRLREAYLKVAPELARQGLDSSLGAVADESYMGCPLDCGYSVKALNTPMMIGTVQACHYHIVNDFSDYQMPEDKKLERVRSLLGEHTDEMVELFRKAYPDDDILNLYHMDYFFRGATLKLLDGRVKESIAPTYSYLVDYNFRFYGGMPAFHGCDLPLVFNNTDTVLAFLEPETQLLGMKVSKAWAAFARTGNPNTELLNGWEEYTEEHPCTEVLGKQCRCVEDLDSELINKHFEYLPYTSPFEIRGK